MREWIYRCNWRCAQHFPANRARRGRFRDGDRHFFACVICTTRRSRNWPCPILAASPSYVRCAHNIFTMPHYDVLFFYFILFFFASSSSIFRFVMSRAVCDIGNQRARICVCPEHVHCTYYRRSDGQTDERIVIRWCINATIILSPEPDDWRFCYAMLQHHHPAYS